MDDESGDDDRDELTVNEEVSRDMAAGEADGMNHKLDFTAKQRRRL